MAVIYFDNRRNRVFRTSRAGPRCSLASGERVSFNPFNRPPNRGENTIARNTFSPKKNKKFQLRNKQTKYDPLSKKRREKDRESERMTSRRIESLFDYKKEYFEKKWKERCHLLRNWRENEGRATGLLLLRSNRREKRNISFTSDTCTCYPIGQTLPSAPRANPHCIEMCVRVVKTRAGFRKDPWVVVAQKVVAADGPDRRNPAYKRFRRGPATTTTATLPFIRPRLNVDFSHR